MGGKIIVPNTPGQPFSNMQPSLAISELVTLQGIFPSRDGGGASGDMLGFIYDFAGNFAPSGTMLADGQLLQIQQYTALFSLLGTSYGGNGFNNFQLPNLQGTAIVGNGSAPGLTQQFVGQQSGSATEALGIAQIPPNSTPAGGGGQAYTNIQPSLTVTPLIQLFGVFPSASGGSGSASFIGQIANFAGSFVPDGWAAADGALMQIADNQALFAIIGTTYGGDGVTTFALPDLRDRVAVGATGPRPVGTKFGSDATTLTVPNLPPPTGSDVPVNNDQPSLSVTWLIALTGVFPSQNGGGLDQDSPFLGQICSFAGNYAPSGWAICDGALLSTSQNQALFAILGTTYGGDGHTTFALPNLLGRTPLNAGTLGGISYTLGQRTGTDTVSLTAANLPTACFVAGTRILTDDGDIAVEDLCVGDHVITAFGECRPIVWIGWRSVSLDIHPEPDHACPILIRAGAFGDELPSRDLRVSPEHAIYIDGHLVPARHLVNGGSIRRDLSQSRFVYFHIELETHDILLTEGLATESWLDTGNRRMFENADVADLHPSFESPADAAWATRACAPLLQSGPKLAVIQARLDAPGCAVEVVIDQVGLTQVVIPAGIHTVRLRSATQSRLPDARVLGALITRIEVDDEILAPCDHRLVGGFHPAELHAFQTVRWTDGCGCLQLEASNVDRTLMVEVSALARNLARAAA